MHLCRPLITAAAFVAAAAVGARAAPAPYALDRSFSLPFPAGVERITALAPSVDAASGAQLLFALQRGVTVPFLCRFAAGASPGAAWTGGCTLGSNETMDSPHGSACFADAAPNSDLLVTDIAGGTVKRFSQAGALLNVGGRQGHPGTGLSPLQFSAPADVAVTSAGLVVVSDGDGGAANRVVALASPAQLDTLVWAVGKNGSAPGEFFSPHSIAYDTVGDTLYVADRGNSRIVALAPASGAVRATWEATACFPGGTPWGLRVDEAQRRLVVADGTHMALMVFDLSAQGCALAANISVPAEICGVPHELAIMATQPRDVYLACVGGTAPPTAGPTSVLRFAAQ